jgi:hypothetical protein
MKDIVYLMLSGETKGMLSGSVPNKSVKNLSGIEMLK